MGGTNALTFARFPLQFAPSPIRSPGTSLRFFQPHDELTMTDPKASRLAARISSWSFALFLIAVAGATGLWFLGADLVRERINTIAAESVGIGGSFVSSGIKVTGFPFAFDAELTGVAVTGRTPRGLWEWRADRVKARISPWRAGGIEFDLAGNHKIRFRLGRQPLDLDITAAHAPGSFTAAGGGSPRTFKVMPSKLAIRDAVTGHRIDAEAASVQLFRYTRANIKGSEISAGLVLNLSGVTLPEAAEKLLGRTLQKFAAEVQLMGDPPLPLERPQLSRWRKDGGVMEIKKLDLAWGPAKLSGEGTLGLDDTLQPEASLTSQISGHQKTLDSLVAAGVVQEQVARSVRLVLDMMSRRSGPGTEAVIRLPLSIQNRVIYVGPARLARLPQIRW